MEFKFKDFYLASMCGLVVDCGNDIADYALVLRVRTYTGFTYGYMCMMSYVP